MGWQRLLPDWYLNSLSIGAFGMHGASRPLPYGRGRSPMNWSLIQDRKVFYTHLFRYKAGVDDGAILGVQKFNISMLDNCHTLHLKNCASMIKLCVEKLPALLDGTAMLTPQSQEKPSYYPKRSEEDGIIFWDDTTLNIYNLIRAITKPFPGAFTFLENALSQKMIIWAAIPFDKEVVYQYETYDSGSIIQVFYDHSFVIKTSDGCLLITDYEGYKCTEKDIGKRFGSLNYAKKEWYDLPRRS
jgi:methionyl-tRNA formyltransferase